MPRRDSLPVGVLSPVPVAPPFTTQGVSSLYGRKRATAAELACAGFNIGGVYVPASDIVAIDPANERVLMMDGVWRNAAPANPADTFAFIVEGFPLLYGAGALHVLSTGQGYPSNGPAFAPPDDWSMFWLSVDEGSFADEAAVPSVANQSGGAHAAVTTAIGVGGATWEDNGDPAIMNGAPFLDYAGSSFVGLTLQHATAEQARLLDSGNGGYAFMVVRFVTDVNSNAFSFQQGPSGASYFAVLWEDNSDSLTALSGGAETVFNAPTHRSGGDVVIEFVYDGTDLDVYENGILLSTFASPDVKDNGVSNRFFFMGRNGGRCYVSAFGGLRGSIPAERGALLAHLADLYGLTLP